MRHIEDDIQEAAFAQYRARGTSTSVLFAIPNGAKRDKDVAARLKKQGVTAGAPDLFAAARGVSFFIELKAPKGRVSTEQNAMHRRIKAAGDLDTFVVFGADELIALLEDRGILRANHAFIAA